MSRTGVITPARWSYLGVIGSMAAYTTATGIERSPGIAKPCRARGGLAPEQTIRIGTTSGLAPKTGKNHPKLPESPRHLLGDGWAGATGGATPKLGGGGPRAQEDQPQDESGDGTAERQGRHESDSFREAARPRPSGPVRRLFGSMVPRIRVESPLFRRLICVERRKVPWAGTTPKTSRWW